MRRLLTLGIVFAGFMTLGPEAWAASKSSSPPIKLEMRRQEYLARLKIETSKRFCSEEGMLRCISISTEQCRGFVDREFSKCLSGRRITDPVPLTGPDVELAEAVGACIGGKMGKTFEKQFKTAGDCTVRK